MELVTKPLIVEQFVPLSESFAVKGEMTAIFLHHTAGWHNPSAVISAWARDQRGAVGTKFVIGGNDPVDGSNEWDGKLFQACQDGRNLYHLGAGPMSAHIHSLGVELCSFGGLRSGKTYVNTNVLPEQRVKLSAPFRGYTEFERYTDAQLVTLRDLLLHVSRVHGINLKDGLQPLISKYGAKAFDRAVTCDKDSRYRGILSHTNVRKDKSDVAPQQELMDMIMSF